MKKTTILLLVLGIIFTSCSIKKKVREEIGKGNFDAAIDMLVHKLSRKRNVKSADEYVLLLEEAYRKARERDLQQIKRLKKDDNPETWEKIYQLYVRLDDRQNRIKSLLPLKIISQNRNARFAMDDYSDEILEARNQMVRVLYKDALDLMRKNDILSYRKAYDLLERIDEVYPNYKNVRDLMKEAYAKGIAWVGVSLENQTGKVIPKKLENDLLDFDAARAQNFWVRYEPLKKDTAQYDFLMKLVFTDIQVSPEKEQERIITQEKEITDGYKYATDANGNIVKDSLGNPIKVPVYRKVTATVHEYRQFKEATIKATGYLYDLHTGKQIASFPYQSRFVFDHKYLRVYGDKRALEQVYLDLLDNKKLPFPSNEQMIYDAGMDLKEKFLETLRQLELP